MSPEAHRGQERWSGENRGLLCQNKKKHPNAAQNEAATEGQRKNDWKSLLGSLGDDANGLLGPKRRAGPDRAEERELRRCRPAPGLTLRQT